MNMTDHSTTTDSAKASPPMVDLQPNITVEQAKRMEAALERRRRCDEDCHRLLEQIVVLVGDGTLAGTIERFSELDRQEAEELVAEVREVLAERKVANRDFEAAVFERPAAPTPDLRADDLVAATEGGPA